MTGQFAKSTSVDAGASRAEIERTLMRYGASAFGYVVEDSTDDQGTQRSRAAVSFVAHGRQVRIMVEMPSRTERRFTHTPSRDTPRTASAALGEWEQACRQKWRAVALLVKALLESVESGIVTFEDAFLPFTIVPGTNRTVAEQVGPELTTAIEIGSSPRLLLLDGPAPSHPTT